MNAKRILYWGGFIVVVGLIIWGMIAAANKAEKENANVAPVDKVASFDWAKGATSSPVTLIEYSDFQCPACAAYFPVVEQLLAEVGDKVLFVYRHFPLEQHRHAVPAAQASEAAGEQGKFWEMYKRIFETQTDWENLADAKAIFAGYAQELKLDMTKYAAAVESKENLDKINNDLKSGLKAGVQGTPTFYLNGKKISPKNYEEFKKLIEDAAANNS